MSGRYFLSLWVTTNRFLRNGDAWCWLRGVENKPERLGAPMQILDHALAVPGLVERRTRIDVLHSMAHGVIEQNCDLARRGGHRLGFADARREPPVERAQGGVGPSNGYGGEPQERRGPAPGAACS